MQVLLQIGNYVPGVKRRKTRPRSDGRVEVYESFNIAICLLAAVVALSRRTVHECIMCANERRASTPLGGISWDIA